MPFLRHNVLLLHPRPPIKQQNSNKTLKYLRRGRIFSGHFNPGTTSFKVAINKKKRGVAFQRLPKRAFKIFGLSFPPLLYSSMGNFAHLSVVFIVENHGSLCARTVVIL